MWFKRRPVPFGDLQTGSMSLETTLRLGDIARDAGDPATAATHYAAVVAQSPDRNDVKVQLGNMLKDAGRLREADAVYQAAQAADPDDPDICIQRGRVKKLMGDRKGAMVLFRKAAALDSDSWDAVDELASVGAAGAQQRRFEVHLRAGGSEAIMHMSRQLTAMRAVLDDMAALLPEALGQTAFPVESYAVFRKLYAVPPPPSAPRAGVTVVLLADREAIPTLQAALSALSGQSAQAWRLLAVVGEPERRAILERAAAVDPRITLVAAAAEDSASVAEWRAARSVVEGWIMLLPQGAFLAREALAWAGAVPALGTAEAYVVDEDQGRVERGRIEHAAPVFRAVVDYDTLLEANVSGETMIIAAEAYARLCPQPPPGSVARARGALLLDLGREGRVGHLPYALVTRLAFVRPSLPEHRLAIEDHAAKHGLADRLVVAKGETGPSRWQPQAPDNAIAIVIQAADKPHELRQFVHSLRDLAAAPDHLRFVIVDSGSTQPDSRAILDELAGKRYVTMLSDAAGNPSRTNNRSAEATDAPLLVFAHDDLTMLTEDWDTRLRGQLERDNVGALGVRLLYGDDTIQHAGILFGWKGMPINDGLFEPAEAPGPARRLQVTRAVSAVTGAFLAIRRDRFLALGGFDERGLPAAYADLDLCLKLRRAGQRILYTPGITLRNHERKSLSMDGVGPEAAARFVAERGVIEGRWGSVLDDDPSLNPIWYPATMPFRLLSAPSTAAVLAHLRRTSRRTPWTVAPAEGTG